MTVPVIHESDVLDSAYQMGYEQFSDAPDEIDDPIEALSHLKESARWANSIAPRLRAMSGYGETPGGTYTDLREVVVIPVGRESDRPIEAIRMSCREVHDEVISAYNSGALDALDGREYGESDDAYLTTV